MDDKQPSLRETLARQFADLEKSGAMAAAPRIHAASSAPPQKQMPISEQVLSVAQAPMPQMGGGMSPGGLADILKLMPKPQQPGLVPEMVPGQFSTVNPAYG